MANDTPTKTPAEQSTWDVAWHRFNVISGIISDTTARVIAVLFYFTILVPFGIISTLFSDPLRRKESARWLERPPVPADIESAREQG